MIIWLSHDFRRLEWIYTLQIHYSIVCCYDNTVVVLVCVCVHNETVRQNIPMVVLFTNNRYEWKKNNPPADRHKQPTIIKQNDTLNLFPIPSPSSPVCMCVCTCICMYVCMYACMYICMYVCMYVYVYMYVYMHVCICIYVCMYACMYMYICMYVCMYMYMYICMCV